MKIKIIYIKISFIYIKISLYENILIHIKKYVKVLILIYNIIYMITTTTKWEDLSPEEIVDNYIRIKNLERERNKLSYEKLKENRTKYFNRLNENLAYQLERIEKIKSDEEKLKEFKERRKEINKRAYERRKLLNQKQSE